MARRIGVLSLSCGGGEYGDMYDSIEKHVPENSKAEYKMLSSKDLNGEITFGREQFHAVILIHSVKEGRLSITDVDDAKYNTLLPALWKEFGSKHVGVIAFSIPGCNDRTNAVKKAAFKEEQPTATICSDSVILCGSSRISSKEIGSLFDSFEKYRLIPQRTEHGGDNFLIIGIKPLIPLLIMQHIEAQVPEAKLTLKTLDACEDISGKSFSGGFIVCNSHWDVKLFKAAQNNMMYEKAMKEVAKLKTVFLPSPFDFRIPGGPMIAASDEELTAEECKTIFQPLGSQNKGFFSRFFEGFFSRFFAVECKTFQYTINFVGEKKSVFFQEGKDITEHVEKHLKNSRRTKGRKQGRAFDRRTGWCRYGMMVIKIMVFLTIIFVAYWFFTAPQRQKEVSGNKEVSSDESVL